MNKIDLLKTFCLKEPEAKECEYDDDHKRLFSVGNYTGACNMKVIIFCDALPGIEENALDNFPPLKNYLDNITGKVKFKSAFPTFTPPTKTKHCEHCNGDGKVDEIACTDCNGTGMVSWTSEKGHDYQASCKHCHCSRVEQEEGV